MKIDPSKLQNVQHKPDRSFIARCPACSEQGADKRGEHLIVYPNGKFGCVANPEDRVHNRAILQFVGVTSQERVYKLPVERLIIPESKTLMNLGPNGPENESPSKSGEGRKDDASISREENRAEGLPTWTTLDDTKS